jgi:hypothetical protein
MSEEYDELQENVEEEVEEEEIEEESDDNEDAADSSGNPAWSELYDVLPKSLHGMVEPVIAKWQSGVDTQFEKFSPYKKFAEAGVNPDVIEASMELARQVASNPKSVYDELAERYGWKEAQAMVEQAVENVEELADNDDIFGDGEQPSAELKALKAELDSLRDDLNSRDDAVQQQALNAEIEDSLSSLAEEYGEFDNEAIVRRAMILADDYPDASMQQLLSAGYEQYSGEMEKMRTVIKKAPKVAGGTANKVPATPAKVLNTREDRIAAIEEIVKRTLSS